MSALSTVEVLREARKLIEDPERWTKGTLARNPRTKRPVRVDSEKAGQFCMWGAVERVAGEAQAFDVWSLLDQAKGPNFYSFASFNDSHTHAAVLAAFDKAIALAEQAAA